MDRRKARTACRIPELLVYHRARCDPRRSGAKVVFRGGVRVAAFYKTKPKLLKTRFAKVRYRIRRINAYCVDTTSGSNCTKTYRGHGRVGDWVFPL